MKNVVSTTKAPGAIGPYSQGIATETFVYSSGQLGLDPETKTLKGTVEEQTKQALENLKAVLEAGGSSMENIVKTTVFLKDMGDFQAMNQVYATFFPQNPPARSAFQVAKLPMDGLVEIEAVALKK